MFACLSTHFYDHLFTGVHLLIPFPILNHPTTGWTSSVIWRVSPSYLLTAASRTCHPFSRPWSVRKWPKSRSQNERRKISARRRHLTPLVTTMINSVQTNVLKRQIKHTTTSAMVRQWLAVVICLWHRVSVLYICNTRVINCINCVCNKLVKYSEKTVTKLHQSISTIQIPYWFL